MSDYFSSPEYYNVVIPLLWRKRHEGEGWRGALRILIKQSRRQRYKELKLRVAQLERYERQREERRQREYEEARLRDSW